MAGELESALAEAGGAGAPAAATARLRVLLLEELDHGARELTARRSGYRDPVTVVVGRVAGGLAGVAPVGAALRADPEAIDERAWLLAAALVGTLVELARPPAPVRAQDLGLLAGEHAGHLLLQLPGEVEAPSPADLDELVPLAFEEQLGEVDRLRARGLAVPGDVLEASGTRSPMGSAHPLRIAEAVARLGGRPADAASVDSLEDAVGALLGPAEGGTRPHEDPEPARRVARRILQRLDGMGKWGGYHTEIQHLPRGFAGNERALAIEVGEALLAAGLLQEKPSVGQRHVFLNPRRAGDIHRLIGEGRVPEDLRLPPS